ncbi:MAG: AMP-binding protein [Gammaproteobacteria bacterium]|nr:AMP-binding protein [Gammaproteobacteria bacterium]
MTEDLWSPGRALHHYANEAADEIALIFTRRDGSHDELTRTELDRWSSQVAYRVLDANIGVGDYVPIVFPNCIEHIVATMGIYKAGGTPMPVSHSMPTVERNALIELASAKIVFADTSDLDGITRDQMARSGDYPDSTPPDVTPQPAKAVASGGSTGKPKLIVSPGPFAYPNGVHPLAVVLQLEKQDLVYSPGPLYHNGPFLITQVALFTGARAIINERFGTLGTLDTIERFHPTVLNLVPTMMQRMLQTETIETRNLSSVRRLWHYASACPAWVKEKWIDLIGADKVWELWAATEFNGLTTISGEEWLLRRGSVGRPIMTEIRIVGDQMKELPPGEIGEIYSRFGGGAPPYMYLGAEPLPCTDDNFSSVGDLGYLDEDGYLYLSDRRVDLIISGGANIFPAEVESIISSHPKVRDVAVVGIHDDDLGQRVHAIVEPIDFESPPDQVELDVMCCNQLARYKSPRTYEMLRKLPRNEAGKIRRLALREGRS